MSEIYNAQYYHNCCGPIPYEEPEHWETFFGCVADQIVGDLKPRTVLDAGCAMGYLVAALRDRGVEAYGVDISEYAISKVREDIRPYCVVASLTEPLPESLPKKYDLVVTIEVLEHLYPEEGAAVIKNLCTLTDKIIFSSTPDDFTERTHVNVQQREYWAKLFAREGFFDDLNYRPIYLTQYASCFKRNNNWIQQIENYERNIRIFDSRILALTDKLAKQDAKIAEQLAMIKERDATIQEHVDMVHERDAKIAEQLAMIQERDATIQEHIDMVHERDAKIAEQLAMIQERDATIQEHIDMVHERDAKIVEQLAMIQERDNTIREHTTIIQERDEVIAAQRAETLEQNVQIENQAEKIKEQSEIIQKYTPPWIRKKLT